MKKSQQNKRESPAAKERTEQLEASTLMDLIEPSYGGIIKHMKKIRAQDIAQGEIIRAAYKKLGKCNPEDLIAAINSLPTRKKMDELEAKNDFLLTKANKLKNKLDEQKQEHQIALSNLNAALLFNQKLEEYVSHPSNEARLFDNNLASHAVSAAKVIHVLVDFVAKIEELLKDMRSLFDGIGPGPSQGVELENVPDLFLETGDIPSLIG